LGCQQFSQIYRRPRGLFISYPLRDSIPALLRNRPNLEVDVIVVTDGERILGIGDQGVGGLGIPIGKLSLYTLIGGIHPARTLPIVLDVGTNNPERLRDPQYLGWRHERVTGQEYFDFVHQFVEAVKQELPETCLQWEDFARTHARPILERYRDELLTFNDDIQGTAAVPSARF
jgi:malate dehydrogenase (oxaloacetate-decarboxylating)